MTWRFSLFALWLVACAHSKTVTQQSQTQTEQQSSSTTTQVVMTRQETGPEVITTTVREYAPPKEVMPSAERQRLRGSRADVLPRPSVTQGVAGEPAHGPLIRETVTVDQRGPSTTDTSLQRNSLVQAKVDTSSTSKTTTATKSSVGLSLATKLALLCGVALAVLLAVKFKIWRVAL